MKTKIGILVALASCTALTGYAGDPPNPKGIPELVVEMITRTPLDANGRPGPRNRQVRLLLTDGKGAVWSTPINADYVLQKGDQSWLLNPGVLARGFSKTVPRGSGSRDAIDGGSLGKKVEEGVTIVGEWKTLPAKSGRGTERWETWWRGDMNSAGPVMRIHHELVTGPDQIIQKDYWYIQTNRLHESLFDPNP